jgi:hypothetical protein
MNQEHLMKVLTTGAKIAKQTSKNMRAKSAEYIKDNILGNEFVTRQEYEQLRQLVLKMSEEIKAIKKKGQ